MADQEYTNVEDSESGPPCPVNATENQPGIIVKSEPKEYSAIKELSEMKFGDHIRQRRSPLNYSHSILVDKSQTDNTFTHIRYKLFPEGERHAKIMAITSSLANGKFEKVIYSGRCFPPEVVVNRAWSRVGEKKYKMWTNSGKGFARWCQTGYGGLLYKWDVMNNYIVPAKPGDINLGDKIVIRKMLYEHHAIVTEVQENGLFTLVEFQQSGINKNENVNLEERTGFRKGYLYKAIPNPNFVVSPDIIVENANRLYEMIQQAGERVEYELTSCNCQHLASFCQSGEWHSYEIQDTLFGFVKRTGLTFLSSITSTALRVGAEILTIFLDIGFSFRIGPIDMFGIIGFFIIEFIFWLYKMIKYGFKYWKAEEHVREELLDSMIDSVEYRNEVVLVEEKYEKKIIGKTEYKKELSLVKEKYLDRLIDTEEYRNEIAAVEENYRNKLINAKEYTTEVTLVKKKHTEHIVIDQEEYMQMVDREKKKYKNKMIDITQRSGVVFLSVAGCSIVGSILGCFGGPIGMAVGSVIGSVVGVIVGELLHKVILHIRRIPKEDWVKWLKGLIGKPKGEIERRVKELKNYIEDNSDTFTL